MAVVVTVTACSGSSAGRTLATVTTLRAASTTSAPPTSTSTTVATTATSVTTPSTRQPSPEDQAKAFYAAWTKGDRAGAQSLGEPAAVAAVFARPWSASDGWSFSECSGAAGSAICTWQGQGSSQQLMLLVRGATGGLSVTVVDAKFA